MASVKEQDIIRDLTARLEVFLSQCSEMKLASIGACRECGTPTPSITSVFCWACWPAYMRETDEVLRELRAAPEHTEREP